MMTDTIEKHSVRSLNGDVREFTGRLLGVGSSRLDTHIHPPGDLPEGLRCSGCRWIETRIWWSESDSSYVVGTKGVTTIEGESDRYKSWWSTNPNGVLDVLLIAPPRKRASNKPEGWRELPRANYDALDQAADLDPRLLDVLEAWEDANPSEVQS